MVFLPARLNATHDVSPMGGVSLTPAAVTVRSLRGTATLKTASLGSSFPFAPVKASIFSVSKGSGGAAQLARGTTTTSRAARKSIRRDIGNLLPSSVRRHSGTDRRDRKRRARVTWQTYRARRGRAIGGADQMSMA